MDAPLIERRRHPIFPPLQALVLYGLLVLVVLYLTHHWVQESEERVEEAKREADYERCIAGNYILEIGNEQARVLRAVVDTAASNRRAAAPLAGSPEERMDALRAAREFEALSARVKEYPTYECRKDGTYKVKVKS